MTAEVRERVDGALQALRLRQTKMLPVSYDRQILPGTFEHTLNDLIDEKIDLSVFEARYHNDEAVRPRTIRRFC